MATTASNYSIDYIFPLSTSNLGFGSIKFPILSSSQQLQSLSSLVQSIVASQLETLFHQKYGDNNRINNNNGNDNETTTKININDKTTTIDIDEKSMTSIRRRLIQAHSFSFISYPQR